MTMARRRPTARWRERFHEEQAGLAARRGIGAHELTDAWRDW